MFMFQMNLQLEGILLNIHTDTQPSIYEQSLHETFYFVLLPPKFETSGIQYLFL